jgi:gliding motility-associated-like protein
LTTFHNFKALRVIRINFLIFSFLVFVSSVFAQGADCSSATQINSVSNYCSGNAFFTNVGSTASAYGLPTCWSATATEDIWFSFTSLGTDVLISASGTGGGGTMSQPRIALYSGTCVGTLTELNCANGTVGFGTTQLYEGALMIGNTYYIRISTTQANEGTFELCINSYTPSANPGADCGGASFLCNQNPVSVAILGGGGAFNDEPETGTCLDVTGPDESNSSWFYWTCGTSGPLTFDITPVNPTDDIDFIFYQLNSANPCGTRTPVRCCASSCLNSTGSTGMSLTDTDPNELPGCQVFDNAYIQSINMVAGTSYALLVNNFSANTGFTLTFNANNPNGGTFVGPNPQISSSSLTICAGGTVVYDALLSQNCSNVSWNFTQNATPSLAPGFGPHTVTYANPGNFTAILNGIDQNGCQSVDFVNVSVNATVQVNIPPFDTICSGTAFNQSISSVPAGASFTYSTNSNPNISGATNGTGSTINQQLTNSSAVNQNITYYVNASLNSCSNLDSCIVTVRPLIDPLFTPMGPYCLGFSPTPVLPTQSLEGITGNWNPSSINTQQLGNSTYNFTPNVNQCADNATMDIQISPNPNVSFSADNLLACSPLQGILTTQSIPNVTYEWFINGQAAGNTSTIDYDLSNPGCYDVELQVDVSGCTATSILNDYLCVEAEPIASFTFIPGEFSAPSENVQFYNSTQGNNTYYWNYGDGNFSSQIEELHQYTNTAQGFFITLTATSPAGCIDSVTQFIGYEEQLVYYIPNTFTPDQDEHNQLWKPIFTSGFDPFNFHVSIFNRWGELIWESYDHTMGWDGTYNKVIAVPEGTYTWVIDFEVKNVDDKKRITGSVNVLR